MKEQKCDAGLSVELMKEIRIEASNPEWCEGFAAFDARVSFTMQHGRKWAMGWLTSRLLSIAPPSRHLH